MEYPEHEKLHKVAEESQVIGVFWRWAQDSGAFGDEFMPLCKTIDAVLAEYFEIDLKKIESEKRAMLEDLRTLQTKAS